MFILRALMPIPVSPFWRAVSEVQGELRLR